MSEAVIVALISFAGTGLGSVIGIVASSKLTAYRLEKLEEKVQKHNNIIERTYRLEAEVEAIHEQIKGGNTK